MRMRRSGGPLCGESLQESVRAMGRKPLGKTAHSLGARKQHGVSSNHASDTMHFFIPVWLGDKRARGAHNEIVFKESPSSSAKRECHLDDR